ncbi:MAG: PAS domain S-box protein [Bacteroidales bacterium]|nr:PAS domain S-box protein [Bacteroidales bacterium]
MLQSVKSLLILEGGIDLKHLNEHLVNHGYSVVYEDNEKQYIDKCKEIKFDLLVISRVYGEDFAEDLFEMISSTQNNFTPVLVIVNNSEFPSLNIISKTHANLITFPFSNDEFLYRCESIIRRTEFDDNVHKSILGYRNLIESVPVGIGLTTEHGDFLSVNPMFATILEMTEEEIKNENFLKLCHPDDYFIKRKQLDRLLKREVETVSFETRLINNEGKTIVCRIKTVIIWNENLFESFLFVIEEVM